MRRQIVLLVLVLGLCCTGAFADLTLESGLGYVQMPSAEVAKKGDWHLSGGYLSLGGTSELSGLGIPTPCDGDAYKISVATGILKSADLSASVIAVDKSYGTATAFNMCSKFKVMEKPSAGLALTVGSMFTLWSSDMERGVGGGQYLDIDLPGVSSMFIVLDKNWETGLPGDRKVKASIGAMYDYYGESRQILRNPPAPLFVPPGLPIDSTGLVAKERFLQPFGAFEYKSGGWTVVGEYKPKLRESNFTYRSEVWSVAVRRDLPGGLTVSGGLSNYNIPYTDSDAEFFVNGTFNF